MAKIGVALFTASVMLTAYTGTANAGAWCAWYDAYTSNCGFATLQQCQATVFGDSTAYCSPNPAYDAKTARPGPRQPYGYGRRQ
jgi:hypothetical protein